MIAAQTWASDSELVYWKSGLLVDTLANSTLHILNIEDGHSRPLASIKNTMSIVSMGKAGHLCVLTELEGRQGLFDLDTRTGKFARLTRFDKALDGLEVYPAFGHSWSEERQEAALIAWPHDYLEEGVEPTKWNSQWLPTFDDPSIPNYVSTRRDGSRVTHRELVQESKRKKPFRLFLLSEEAAYLEVPGTNQAHQPLWSPDGSLLACARYEETGEILWILRRSDLSLHRVGALCSLDPIAHPSGSLFYRTVDETIPRTDDRLRERMQSARWHQLLFKNGQTDVIAMG